MLGTLWISLLVTQQGCLELLPVHTPTNQPHGTLLRWHPLIKISSSTAFAPFVYVSLHVESMSLGRYAAEDDHAALVPHQALLSLCPPHDFVDDRPVYQSTLRTSESVRLVSASPVFYAPITQPEELSSTSLALHPCSVALMIAENWFSIPSCQKRGWRVASPWRLLLLHAGRAGVLISWRCFNRSNNRAALCPF